MASFSVSGLVPISAAIAGSEVAITVESMFSMNRAVATIRGMMRCLSTMTDWYWQSEGGAGIAAYHRRSAGTIADQRIAPKSCARSLVIPGRALWREPGIDAPDRCGMDSGLATRRARNDGGWGAHGLPTNSPTNSPKKPVHGWPAVRIALIRHPAVLSTRVNPTDGLRFSGDAARHAEGGAHP